MGQHDDDQLMLALPIDEMQDGAQVWACTVLVTHARHAISAVSQRYRDSCACESGCDELTNRWDWGGFI